MKYYHSFHPAHPLSPLNPNRSRGYGSGSIEMDLNDPVELTFLIILSIITIISIILGIYVIWLGFKKD